MIFKQIRKYITSMSQAQASVTIDNQIVEAFSRDPDAPFLVSFPRTGSHWLRILMELYFERPTLVRAFYYPEKDDYLLVHSHDNDLDIQRRNVIYLYREPVATIYSQLSYYQEALDDVERIHYWSDLYGQHLIKWLVNEQFTTHKTILTYEGLQQDLATEFEKVTQHFNQVLNHERLQIVAAKVTKEEVKRKTPHDEQVVQIKKTYQITRDEFRNQQAKRVWDTVLHHRVVLGDILKIPSL